MKKLNKAMTLKTDKADKSKRSLLGLAAVTISVPIWLKPTINAVILPAHAQTSMCETEITVGGPLSGHPSGALTCQAACEAEAMDRNAQLCAVRETDTVNGTDCACDLDLN